MNDRDGTKQRLLDAGRKLFADNGFDGASVRAITTAARANLGAVTYHFGSKQALYAAVLEQLFTRMGDRVLGAAASVERAPARLGAVVRAIFAFFAEYPETPRLMIRHLATTGAPPAAAMQQFRRVPEAIMEVVRAGQARGELRAVEPLLATFTLVAQAVWFAVVRRPIALVTGVPLDRPEMADAVERHIIDVVRRAFDPASP